MDYDGACKELLKWNTAGGKVVAGLQKRRTEEYEKCSAQSNSN
jgi:lysozyme